MRNGGLEAGQGKGMDKWEGEMVIRRGAKKDWRTERGNSRRNSGKEGKYGY